MLRNNIKVDKGLHKGLFIFRVEVLRVKVRSYRIWMNGKFVKVRGFIYDCFNSIDN